MSKCFLFFLSCVFSSGDSRLNLHNYISLFFSLSVAWLSNTELLVKSNARKNRHVM